MLKLNNCALLLLANDCVELLLINFSFRLMIIYKLVGRGLIGSGW